MNVTRSFQVWIGNRNGLIHVLTVMREKSFRKAKELKVKKVCDMFDILVNQMIFHIHHLSHKPRITTFETNRS